MEHNEHPGSLSLSGPPTGGEPVGQSLITPGHTGNKEEPIAKSMGKRSMTMVREAIREVYAIYSKMQIQALPSAVISLWGVLHLIRVLLRRVSVDGLHVPNELVKSFVEKHCVERPGTGRPYFVRLGGEEGGFWIVACKFTKEVLSQDSEAHCKFAARFPVMVRTHLGTNLYLTKDDAVKAGLLVKPDNSWQKTYAVAWDPGCSRSMLDGLVLSWWDGTRLTQADLTEFHVGLAVMQWASDKGLCDTNRVVYPDGTTDYVGYVPLRDYTDAASPKDSINRETDPNREKWFTAMYTDLWEEERGGHHYDGSDDDHTPEVNPSGIPLLGKPNAVAYELGRERVRIEPEMWCYKLVSGELHPIRIFNDGVEDEGQIRVKRGGRPGYTAGGWRKHADKAGCDVRSDWRLVGAVFAIIRGMVEERAFTAVRFKRKSWGFGSNDEQMKRAGCNRCGDKPRGKMPCWLKARHAWQCTRCGTEIWLYKAQVLIPAKEFAVMGTEGKYVPIFNLPGDTLIGVVLNGEVVANLMEEHVSEARKNRARIQWLRAALGHMRKNASDRLKAGLPLTERLLIRADLYKRMLAKLTKGQVLNVTVSD